MFWLSWNLEASISWNLSRPVMGVLYLLHLHLHPLCPVWDTLFWHKLELSLKMGKHESVKPEGFIFYDKKKSQVFRDTKPCGLVNRRRRVKDYHCLHSQYLSSTVSLCSLLRRTFREFVYTIFRFKSGCLNPEDGESKLARNVGSYVPVYTMSRFRRHASSPTSLLESQVMSSGTA